MSVAAAKKLQVPEAVPYELLPIEALHESSTNPRKVFRDVEALADSVQVHGVLQPILARPIPAESATHATAADGQYQVVAGARRLRAAKLAGLTQIPAIVRAMTETQMMEIQLIENNQRKDVEPLDEAFGFKALLDKGYDVKSLAEKLGRDESYVYQRMQLTKLTDAWQQKLAEGEILFSHAVQIARLAEAHQEKVHTAMLEELPREPWTVARLHQYIERNFHLDLSAAGFSKKDPELVAGVGPCTTCHKRSGFNRMLFPEIQKKDICTDPLCFGLKEKAYVQLQVKKAQETEVGVLQVTTQYDSDDQNVLDASRYDEVDPADGIADDDEIRTAVVVSGHKPGRVIKIKLRRRDGGGSGDGDTERAERKRAEMQQAANVRVMEAILAAVDRGPNLLDLQGIAAWTFGNLYHDGKVALMKHRDWKKPEKLDAYADWMTPAAVKFIKAADLVELHAFMWEMMLIGATRCGPHTPGGLPEELIEAGKLFDVDAKAIEVAAKKEIKGAAKKPAKKKGGKK